MLPSNVPIERLTGNDIFLILKNFFVVNKFLSESEFEKNYYIKNFDELFTYVFLIMQKRKKECLEEMKKESVILNSISDLYR